MRRFQAVLTVLALGLSLAGAARAATATVAVAANFLTTAESLAEEFSRETGHQIELVPGSTGKLFAQIVNGAPFDVFLAADAARPAALEDRGLAASRKPYAFGRLVLLVRGRREASLAAITDDDLRIAIADPELAPYGVAARQVLAGLRGTADWRSNVVLGADVGQAMSFLATRNADAAILALSQLVLVDFRARELVIPPELYDPIQQDVVLLEGSTSNPAARAFFEYLASPAALRLIESAGYGTER